MPRQKKIAVIIAVVVLSPVAINLAFFIPKGPTSGDPITPQEKEGLALLVMDMQRDFLRSDGRMPVDRNQVEPLIEAVNTLIDEHEEKVFDVLFVANAFSPYDVIGNLFRNFAAVAATERAALDSRIRFEKPNIFFKRQPDAFTNPKLDEYLRANKLDHLVITGVFADQCVAATSQGAINRNYKVTLIKEAVASIDNDARDKALKKLKEKGATVTSLTQWMENVRKVK